MFRTFLRRSGFGITLIAVLLTASVLPAAQDFSKVEVTIADLGNNIYVITGQLQRCFRDQ